MSAISLEIRHCTLFTNFFKFRTFKNREIINKNGENSSFRIRKFHFIIVSMVDVEFYTNISNY